MPVYGGIAIYSTEKSKKEVCIMLKTGSYGIGGNPYKSNAAGKKKSTEAKGTSAAKTAEAAQSTESQSILDKIGSSESKLSAKAQKYLDGLRKQYGDYDFIVANADDDVDGLVGQSTKEFAVVFSSDELERMADDENFAEQQMKNVDKAVKISKMLMGEESSVQFGDGVTVSSVSITFDDKGTMKMFAELEKSTASMQEKAEEAAKKKAEEKKAEAKEDEAADKADKKQGFDKSKTVSLKHASVSANSIEELLDEIDKVDWNSITAESFILGENNNFYA